MDFESGLIEDFRSYLDDSVFYSVAEAEEFLEDFATSYINDDGKYFPSAPAKDSVLIEAAVTFGVLDMQELAERTVTEAINTLVSAFDMYEYVQ